MTEKYISVLILILILVHDVIAPLGTENKTKDISYFNKNVASTSGSYLSFLNDDHKIASISLPGKLTPAEKEKDDWNNKMANLQLQARNNELSEFDHFQINKLLDELV